MTPTRSRLAAHVLIVALTTAASTFFFWLAGANPVAGLCGGLLVHGVLLLTGRD